MTTSNARSTKNIQVGSTSPQKKRRILSSNPNRAPTSRLEQSSLSKADENTDGTVRKSFSAKPHKPGRKLVKAYPSQTITANMGSSVLQSTKNDTQEPESPFQVHNS